MIAQAFAERYFPDDIQKKKASRTDKGYDGEWRMANGEWRMANGEWRMANGEWRMAMMRWKSSPKWGSKSWEETEFVELSVISVLL